MRHPSRPSVRGLAAIGVAALALTACSGGDDDDADATTPPATESAETTTVTTTTPAASSTTAASTDAPTTTADTTTSSAAPATTAADDGSNDDDDDMIIVASIDDLPPECVALLGEFLQLIEPAVQDVDWDTATLGDFQAISDQLAADFDDMDTRELELGCENYDLTSDEAALEAAIEIAEQQAPGTVGWLEFIAAISSEQPSGSSDEGPQDCDGAIAYIEGLIADGMTLSDIPFSEINTVTQAFNVISSDCPTEQATEFFQRTDVANFSS